MKYLPSFDYLPLPLCAMSSTEVIADGHGATAAPICCAGRMMMILTNSHYIKNHTPTILIWKIKMNSQLYKYTKGVKVKKKKRSKWSFFSS